MRILVTGGYGFIGSHLVDRLSKEGHEVHIVDNLSTGKYENVKKRVKDYIMDINDFRLDEIFSSNLYDIVVHLAAQTSVSASIENPVKNEQVNICGLSNMIHLSQKYGVKKFIFASSAAVYGDQGEVKVNELSPTDPMSPYGLSKLMGESLLEYYAANTELETVALRFSNVYGPRQSLSSESGVIAIFTDLFLHQKPVKIYGNGEQKRDFIYVGDVVQAIIRSIEYHSSAIMNISSNQTISINELVENYEKILMIDGNVNYEKARTGDIYYSCLDNSLAVSSLTWNPRFTLQEGLIATLQWAREDESRQKQKNKREKKKKKQSSLTSKILPFIENFVAYAMTILIVELSMRYQLAVNVDFMLFYIIIIAITYGLRQSALAITFASIYHIYGFLITGVDPTSVLFDTELLIRISSYVFVGALLGYSIDSFRSRINDKQDAFDDLDLKFKHMYELYQDSKLVRKELQKQIRSSDDSFTKIYDATTSLNFLKPELIYDGIIRVFEDIMRNKSVAIYVLSDDKEYVRLIANSRRLEKKLDKSKALSDFPHALESYETRQVFINKYLEPDAPMMMAPIVIDNDVKSFIILYEMEFASMNLYNQNLFNTLVDLVTASLIRAFNYNKVASNEKYVDKTQVVKWAYFKEMLYSRISTSDKARLDYTILRVNVNRWHTQMIHDVISDLIRDVDTVAVGPDGLLLVLLTNTNHQEAQYVIRRLRENNIDVTIMKQEKINELFISALPI